MELWLIVPLSLNGLRGYLIYMDTTNDNKNDIKIKPPTVKLFNYVGMLAEREKFPIHLAIKDEHSFIFYIPYQLLADTLFNVIKEKHPNISIHAVKNKIVFDVDEGTKMVVVQDIEDVISTIYTKFKVKIALEFPSNNEYVVIAKAEPFALFISQKTLSEVKKKNQDVIRLFKFLKGELEIPGEGWSLVVGVKYVNAVYNKLEEMID